MSALASFIYTRAWWVMAATLLVTCVAAFVATDVFDRVQPFDIDDPDSEVVAATARVEAGLGRSAEPQVVVMVPAGDDATRPTAFSIAKRLKAVDGVAKVTTPKEDGALSSDVDGSYLVVAYLEPGTGRVEAGEAVSEEFGSDPAVLLGGTAVAAQQVGDRSERDTRRIELYAAPIIFLLLLIVFRTFVAALLPLVIAAISIIITLAALRLITSLTSIDLFALQTVTGLGTGLAINYSLFVIARYREEMLRNESYERALATTLRHAGRTVVFSAITVAAALSALLVFPQPFLHSTGIAGALTALAAGATALLVLPAALALLGPSVNSLAVRDLRERRPEVSSGLWRRLPALVCRSPIPALLIGGALMVGLATQAQSADVTTPDARELPPGDSALEVAESLGSYPGIPTNRLFAVVPDQGADPIDLDRTLSDLPAIVSISAPKDLPDGSELVEIGAATDPLSDAGEDLVHEVRDRLPPGSLVGGRAAEQVDQRKSIEDHVPLALLVLLVTNLLTLAIMTRSVILPVIALAMNLLTVVASLGALTLVFDSQRLLDLLGASEQPGIDISVPVIAFAVAFGLATDYGIFLFARIREERARVDDERDAIVEGVASTGRLISASAILMAVAVGAFVFSDLVIVKEFAVAIAVAVLLDATLVRAIIIPATLQLMGRWAWWRPGLAGGHSRSGES